MTTDKEYHSTYRFFFAIDFFRKKNESLFFRSFYPMPAKAAQPKKPAKDSAGASGGGKAKKKKWSKGKVRDKLNNMVRFIPNFPFVFFSTSLSSIFRSYSIKQPMINVSKIYHNINLLHRPLYVNVLKFEVH
jgi:hypothetical protein